ncbi:TonB-dependent receptor [Microbulbifer hainanensis]|uniref:TonB-dependent receptor n=1 Tax=Microbulbifer hainanensis TaxID=2735675 RepID=UPI001865EE74|nr:TonB-dependent receptor [Microbulbifer hainanensis]
MFKQRLLCSSIAMVGALGGMQAIAQTDSNSSGAIEEVEVTGIRASLEKAIDIKQQKMQIVDSIVAEDIGKFPDNNVVEALQRVSGVQVTDRGTGEVNTVSIRGLTDVTTTVNGRQIFTASGRSVALADVPASLLKSVDVYKTRSANQLESGIAGQIDIHTQRPFDFDGSKVVLAARGINQEQADSTDPNLSGLFSNRWQTSAGDFGALVNFSYAETNYRDQSITPGAVVPFVTGDAPDGWVPYERIFPTDGRVSEDPVWQPGLESGLPYGAGSTLQMNGQDVNYVLGRDAIFASDFTGKRERPAANISLQFAPNDSSEYLFEAFYNGYRNESFNSLMFSFVDWWGDASGLPRGGDVELYPGTNVVKARDVDHPYGFNSGDLTESQTDSYVYALGGKWDISDSFRLESEIVYQNSKYETNFIAMRTDRVAYGLGVDFNSGDGMPDLEFYDDPATPNVDESDLTDASQWNVAQLYDNGGSSEGDALTYTLDGELDVNFGWVNKLDFGLSYDARGASEATRGQDAYLGRPLSELPDGLQYTSRGFFDGRTDIPTEWVVANGYYLSDHIGEFRSMYGLQAQPLEKTFEIDEATTSLYLQGDFDTEIAGKTLDGEFGLRYVSADTDMTFYDIDVDAGQPGHKSSATASNSKLLPSFVTRYHLTDDLMARFAYTETLRRPNFSQLNSFIYYYEDVTNIGYGTASGGNPDLKPVESQNLDLSLEWYFSDTSAIYGTLFRRNIDGFVYDSVRRVTYQGPDDTAPYPYILSQPDNSSDGVLKGFELGAVYFPDNLPAWLDGFGVQASYTALDSSQKIPLYDELGNKTGMKETPMFGVSDSSYSVVLAYDKGPADMRLSYVWRDDFLNNYEARLFANPLGVYRKAETSMDFQASYDVTDNLLVTFDATNLLDGEYQSYYENPSVYNFGSSIYSRTFALGARYSF